MIDNLFLQITILTPLISSIAFLFFALPYTICSWRDSKRVSRFRIQKVRIPASKIFWPSLRSLTINTVAYSLGLIFFWPLIRFSEVHAEGTPQLIQVIWQIPVFAVIDDVLYYWIHRALHTRWLYRHVHSLHHSISAPWAIAGGYFHPVEYVLILFCSTAGPILLGSHIVTIWIWIIIRQWGAAYGHAGYVFPWHIANWLRIIPTPAYHDNHHSCCSGNYANYFPFLDRIFNTALKETLPPGKE